MSDVEPIQFGLAHRLQGFQPHDECLQLANALAGRFPHLQIVFRDEPGQCFGIALVGLVAKSLRLGESLDPQWIDHEDRYLVVEQEVRQRLVIDTGGLHASLGPALRHMYLDPVQERLEAAPVVVEHLAAVLALRGDQRDIELLLADIDSNR